MSALIRDLGVANRDCSGLDLIFLKFNRRSGKNAFPMAASY